MKARLMRFLRRVFDVHDPNPYAFASLWERQKERGEIKPVYATWDEYQRELRTRHDTVYQRATSGENVRQIRSKAK